MGEFFKGWKRKAIAATIVLSLPICLWWLRSNFVNDDFSVALAKDVYFDANSNPRGLNLQLQWFTAGPGDPDGPPGMKTLNFYIHYTYVILPAAALFAYLVLTAPRPQKPVNSTFSAEDAASKSN